MLKDHHHRLTLTGWVTERPRSQNPHYGLAEKVGHLHLQGRGYLADARFKVANPNEVHA